MRSHRLIQFTPVHDAKALRADNVQSVCEAAALKASPLTTRYHGMFYRAPVPAGLGGNQSAMPLIRTQDTTCLTAVHAVEHDTERVSAGRPRRTTRHFGHYTSQVSYTVRVPHYL